VFCRHVCPVQARVPLKRDATDLDHLAEVCSRFLPYLSVTETFSVQTRLLANSARDYHDGEAELAKVGSGWPYARYDVNTRLSEGFMGQGIRLDVRQPEQILSVVLAEDEGYLGVSHAVDNVSDWAGGERRFKREEGQVSRAEFKLLEAMEAFDLSLPAGGAALDLGAAPGGWTRILRKHGMNVVAVDPAALDARIAADPAVRHMRETAQSYLLKSHEAFDVILSDMRMDAQIAARIMLMAGRNLQEGGWALLTLKLPKRGTARVVASALEVMREGYEVTGARQLFHNRSEVTVALRKLT